MDELVELELKLKIEEVKGEVEDLEGLPIIYKDGKNRLAGFIKGMRALNLYRDGVFITSAGSVWIITATNAEDDTEFSYAPVTDGVITPQLASTD